MLWRSFKVTCRRKIKILTVVTARRKLARRRVCGKSTLVTEAIRVKAQTLAATARQSNPVPQWDKRDKRQ